MVKVIGIENFYSLLFHVSSIMQGTTFMACKIVSPVQYTQSCFKRPFCSTVHSWFSDTQNLSLNCIMLINTIVQYCLYVENLRMVLQKIATHPQVVTKFYVTWFKVRTVHSKVKFKNLKISLFWSKKRCTKAQIDIFIIFMLIFFSVEAKIYTYVL